jgi:hypothetical protein
MDQQHQNYESFNDFSFVNAFAAGSENSYALPQQQLQQQQQQNTVGSDINTKNMNELGLPTLLNQGFDSRAIGNSSLYDLSNPQYSHMPYHHHHNQMPSASMSGVPNLSTESEQRQHQPPKEKDVTEKAEQLTDQPCSSKSDTVAFDASQNTMMKALGVVRKDVLSANSNKKRKRIVVLNDDSDDDASNLKSEIFDNSNDHCTANDDKNDASESDVQTDNEKGEENLTDIGALKAKYLLKNAVKIQGPDKKKKKSRLLDSDDENQMQTTSVDDIGVMNEDENEEESFENDILITEPVIPIESSTLPAECQESEIKKPSSPPAEPEKEIPHQASTENDTKAIVEDVVPNKADDKTESIEQKDDSLKTAEEGVKVQSGDENEIDPSMSVEAILEKINPMADDDEFFKFEKSSDENDKTITNDEYFGSPDKQVQQGYLLIFLNGNLLNIFCSTYKGKKRGPKPGSKRTPKDHSLSAMQQRKKRGDRYEEYKNNL